MRTENDNGLIFDSLNAIFINNEYDDFNDIANSDNLYTIEGDNYFTDFSLVLQDLNFDGRLYTDGDITINATSVTSESKNSIIAFHTGNIVINSNEFNYKGNTARLVIFDEAFNNMDNGRIDESIELLRKLGLQAIICAPDNKIANISTKADKTLVLYREGRDIDVFDFDKEMKKVEASL